METAVLAALAGLFGIVLGRVWDVRLEAVRWRRDQRVRVYEDLAATYMRHVSHCWDWLWLSQARQRQMLLRSGHLLSLLNGTVVATWFHGSFLVTATLQQFDHQLSRLFDKARACRLTWEEFAG